MEVPLELSFRGLTKTDDVERFIDQQVDKLERVSDHIISCRVAVEVPQRSQTTGSPYRVRITVRVPPGHELVVVEEPGEGDIHDELVTVLRRNFAAMKRQLKALMDRRRGVTKVHAEQEATALVQQLNHEEGYGFIQTIEGREIYFHRNSVVNEDFDRLEVGTAVRFVAQEGEKGPQASTVQIVDKPGPRLGRGGEESEAPMGWGE
jgi:cold shock CspA family protein